jgi:hypothetical protein
MPCPRCNAPVSFRVLVPTVTELLVLTTSGVQAG